MISHPVAPTLICRTAENIVALICRTYDLADIDESFSQWAIT